MLLYDRYEWYVTIGLGISRVPIGLLGRMCRRGNTPLIQVRLRQIGFRGLLPNPFAADRRRFPLLVQLLLLSQMTPFLDLQILLEHQRGSDLGFGIA